MRFTLQAARLVLCAGLTIMASAGARAQCPVVFTAGTPVPGLASDFVMAVADLNNDGHPDLLTAGGKLGGGGNAGNNLAFALGNGDGTFQTPTNLPDINGGYGARQILVGLVSNDAFPDVLVVNWDSPRVTVLINDGQPSTGLSSGVDLSGFPDHNSAGALGRFDTDANTDLMIGGRATRILRGSGGATFLSPNDLSPVTGTSGIASGDFNGDTKLDVVWVDGTNVILALGNGDGTFQTGVTFNGRGGGGHVAVGDVNGDGQLDIVTNVSGGVRISLGDGNGGFGIASFFACAAGNTTDLRLADLNRDGLLDLVTVSAADGAVVCLGMGDGSFIFQTPLGPSGQGAREVGVGDFNSDGWLDVAVLVPGQSQTAIWLQTPPSLSPELLASVPALNGSVRAILPYLEQSNRASSEETVVAGSFTKFGVTPASRVALYDGATYIGLGLGLNGTVNALANFTFDAGGPDSTVLVAGGAFTKSGTAVKLAKVAVFDGKFWSPLGDSSPVTPASATKVEGDTSDNLGEGGEVWVSQVLYQENEIRGLLPGDIIRGVRFRLNGVAPTYPVAQQVWPRFDIKLGVGGASLTDTFAQNFVGTPVTVRTGPLTMIPGFLQGSGSPRWFSNTIEFSKPYVYKGGPLLFELRSISGTEPMTFDAHTVPPTSGEVRFAGGLTTSDPDAKTAQFSDDYVWVLEWDVEPGPGRGFNGTVNALASGVFTGQTSRGFDPVLVAAGAFTKSGVTPVNRVAMWDGEKWIPVGAGFNGAVNALLIADLDGAGPQGNSLIAAGAFTKSGASVLNRIAWFDGVNWQPLGAGFNGAVNALAVHNFGQGDELVAGGAFTKSGVTSVARVARFDGMSWKGVGSGLSGAVNSLTSGPIAGDSTPALFAGGAFTKSGARTVNRFAIFRAGDWEQAGDGAASTVRVVKLISGAEGPLGPVARIGGDFKKVGTAIQPYVAGLGCPADTARQALLARGQSLPAPCSVADLAGGGADGASPDGQITVEDALAFMRILDQPDVEPASADDIPADETTPADDVVTFVTAFADGC